MRSTRYFQHADAIWSDYPQLVAGTLAASGLGKDADVGARVAELAAVAEERLAAGPESEFPEVRAWRRAFAQMGLKPTQYRCASESLLRRFRKEGALPRIHPVVDLCNAVSLAFAIPVAALDVSRVAEPDLEVRYATGAEDYQTFAGTTEHPDPGEVVFADSAGRAHARRWTNRQSGLSAVSESTTDVLIVAEAMHGTAPDDVPRLLATLAADLTAHWPQTAPEQALLHRSAPRFTYRT